MNNRILSSLIYSLIALITQQTFGMHFACFKNIKADDGCEIYSTIGMTPNYETIEKHIASIKVTKKSLTIVLKKDVSTQEMLTFLRKEINRKDPAHYQLNLSANWKNQRIEEIVYGKGNFNSMYLRSEPLNLIVHRQSTVPVQAQLNNKKHDNYFNNLKEQAKNHCLGDYAMQNSLNRQTEPSPLYIQKQRNYFNNLKNLSKQSVYLS